MEEIRLRSRALLEEMSPRRRQVAALVARGLPNKAVAAELGISRKTVEKHRQWIYMHLGVHDTASFVHLAIALGLTTPMFMIE